MEKTYNTREFAELVGREMRTLYTWKREGRLVPKKDFSGRYFYSHDDYEMVMGLKDCDSSNS